MMHIGLVNDQPMALEHLRRVLAGQPGLALLWTAADGAQAVQRCAAQRPDLVLMDLFMPVLGGAEATRQIMAHSPCAVLVVTADVDLATREAFAALQHGALDVVAMPLPAVLDEGRSLAALLAKIEQLRRLMAGGGRTAAADAAPGQRLLLLGGSTGAPGVLLQVLRALPQPLPWPVVVAQHIGVEFAAGMAAWLDRASGHRTVLAAPGARVQQASVHLAGHDGHLLIERGDRFTYTPLPRDYAYRPSINRLFESAVLACTPGAAVVFSGMGADGAQGLLALRNAGWATLVQAPASCEIDSMPRAALALLAAGQSLAPSALALALTTLMTAKGASHANTSRS